MSVSDKSGSLPAVALFTSSYSSFLLCSQLTRLSELPPLSAQSMLTGPVIFSLTQKTVQMGAF